MQVEQQSMLQSRSRMLALPGWGSVHVQHLEHAGTAAAARPVLIFLHEALGSVAMWKDVPAQLAVASGCNALIYDRLGHGASDPLPPALSGADYLQKESWEILPAVLEACDVRQAVLIGHSDGGSIALLAAAKLPQRVTAVITEAAHVFVEERTLRGIRQVVGAADVEELKAKVARYHQQAIEPIFNRWPRVWLSEEFADWNIENFLPEVRCPLLVIQGKEDEFGTDRQVEAIVEGAGGAAEALLIPGCRHIPHFQAREEYSRRVGEFLRQYRAGR